MFVDWTCEEQLGRVHCTLPNKVYLVYCSFFLRESGSIIDFFAGNTQTQNCMYTHHRGAKAYEKAMLGHMLRKFKLGYWLMYFSGFFSSVFLLISYGFFGRKEELSNTCWAMASLQLTVATLEGAELENSDRRRFQKFVLFGSHTWIQRIFLKVFSDVRFIFMIYFTGIVSMVM